MCKEAVAHKIDLLKQLGSVLQGTVKPCEFYSSSLLPCGSRDGTLTYARRSRSSVITQCSVQELYDQEKEFKAAVELAKTFERRRCNHRQPIPGDECVSSVVGERTLLVCLHLHLIGLTNTICRRDEQAPLRRRDPVSRASPKAPCHPCRPHCPHEPLRDDS